MGKGNAASTSSDNSERFGAAASARRSSSRSTASGRVLAAVGAAACGSVRHVPTVIIVLLVVIAILLVGGWVIGLAFSLLWFVLTGLIIGALGRLVLPGRQDISLLATALVGIAASLLGGILADVFDAGWLIQFAVAVALAAVGITLFASTERGRGGDLSKL